MTDIEQKALALLREVEDERGTTSSPGINRVSNNHEALCRAIQQHEAFRQEVSDAVYKHWGDLPCAFERFLIPEPVDPLVEVMNEMGFGMSKTASEEFREALAKRGYEIREKAGD